MNDEQEAMWEALKTLPYNFERDGIEWISPVNSVSELMSLPGNNGEVVLVKSIGVLYMSINKQWKKISG